MADAQPLDLDELLYSIPTVTNEWPPTVPRRWWPWQRPLFIHEDDWRQTEFVAADLRELVDKEFDDINRVKRDAAAPSGGFVGFKSVHVRERLPQPLVSRRIQTRDLARLDRSARRVAGVCVGTRPSSLANGFARILSDGTAVYGVARSGLVTHLCLQRTGNETVSPTTTKAFRAFAGDFNLLCVNWTRGIVVSVDAEQFEAVL